MSMSEDLRLACDAAYFSERIALQPDLWQADLLTSGWLRKIVNCSRQTGKSTTAATKVLHEAVYTPSSLSLVFSPVQRQSQELLAKVNEAYNSATVHLPAKVVSSKSEITLANGSRIISLPGTQATVRGYSAPDLIIIDEAAYVPDDLYTAIRPMMATNPDCELILLSTPHGKRGFFYEAWTSEEGWKKYEVPANTCDRIQESFLQEELDAHGEILFQQEYFCRFVDTEEQIFLTDQVEAAFGGTTPLHSDVSDSSIHVLNL